MEGTSKSRVFAYRDELDAWRKERLNGILSKNGKGSGFPKHRRLNASRILLWLLPFLAVITAAAIFLLRPSPGQPADFRIQGSKLFILDEKGKELWAFDTGLANLEPEKVYRERFQVSVYHPPQNTPLFPYLMIKDLDSDGKTEVIFCAKTKFEMGEGEIFCFSAEGKENWHYRLGREVEFGGRKYSSDFRIFGFMSFDIDDDGKMEILIFAPHQPHSPTQLIILNTGGRVIGDFFNFGHMNDFLCRDLDGDGKKELLVVGMNDEYGKGCLIVFDSSRISGCSPQIIEYPREGLTFGTEKYYILFPRTDVDQNLFPLKESMHKVELLRNGRVQVIAGTSHLYFEMDPDLRLQDVKGSDFFRDKHRELKAAGKITSVLDDAYYEELKSGVLYWDGTEWTSTPTMNKNRNNPR